MAAALGCSALLWAVPAVVGCSRLLWAALGCFGLLLAALGSGLFLLLLGALGCSGLLSTALSCSGLFLLLWAALGCNRPLSAALGCSGMLWAVLGFSGLLCGHTCDLSLDMFHLSIMTRFFVCSATHRLHSKPNLSFVSSFLIATESWWAISQCKHLHSRENVSASICIVAPGHTLDLFLSWNMTRCNIPPFRCGEVGFVLLLSVLVRCVAYVMGGRVGVDKTR